MHKLLTLALLSTFSLTSLAQAATVYAVDPIHSSINFKIRHHFNQVIGSFGTYSGEIHFDEANPANSKAIATIQVASVDTNNERRDGHLQRDDFFNAEVHPAIEFASTQWEATGENKFKVTGDLTMLGQTKPVVLDVEFLGSTQLEYNGQTTTVTGWYATGKLNRKDWGIAGGPVIVGDEVQLELSIQARKQ